MSAWYHNYTEYTGEALMDDSQQYNVPGSTTYNPGQPDDYIVTSVRDPRGVELVYDSANRATLVFDPQLDPGIYIETDEDDALVLLVDPGMYFTLDTTSTPVLTINR
jgi:hypothetical protein